MATVLGPKPDKRVAIFAGVSVVLHLVVLGVAVGVGAGGHREIDLDKSVVKTRLVKLGKKRDEKLLPRIAKEKPKPKPKEAAPPKPVPDKPAPPKAEPKPAPKPEAKPEPEKPAEKKPSAQDLLQKFAEENAPEPERPSIDDLIADRIGEEEDEGHEDGSKIGEEISGRLKATYNDKLLARVKNALVAPATLSEQERLFLKAVLFVAIDADGSLLDARISKSSGNSGFDNAVLAAAKKTSYGAPPIPVRDFYRAGVAMNVCPIRCK